MTQPLVFWRNILKQRAKIFYQEHRDLVQTGAVFLLAGSVYLVLVLLTPIRIPCMLHLTTGLYCPGCGISRFFVELAHFRFLSAMRQNLAVAVLLPFWCVIGLIEFWWNPRFLAKGSRIGNFLTWASVAILVLFGILRNIPFFAFLQPTV